MKNEDKITKFKFFLDMEKELSYINEMNKKGWKLVFIKWGCFYTFIKSEPDEYITILHYEDKEKISGIAAFAAQCGYENIPHTMDGLGETLYLTGKKSEISEDFVNDTKHKIYAQKIIFKKFVFLACIFTVIDLILCGEIVFCARSLINFALNQGKIDPSDIPYLLLCGLFIIFTIFYIVMSGFVITATIKMGKKIRNLKKDSGIYEFDL